MDQLFLPFFNLSWNEFWGNLFASLKKLDWGHFSFYLSMVLLGVSFIIFLVTSLTDKAKHDKYLNQIKEETSTIRVYRIDGPRNSVRYFNLSDISKVKTVSLDEFYQSFPSKEQSRIQEWISGILDGKQVPQFLQTDVIFHQEHRQVPSFLRVAQSDPSKGLIHLDSYLLRYEGENPTKGTRHYSTEDDFAQAIKANGVQTGVTFCFSLLPSKAIGSGLDDSAIKASIPNDVEIRFQNIIAPYAKGKEKLIRASDSEIIIANFDMLEPSQAINFALRVVNNATKLLQSSKKRHEPDYEIRAGIVSNKDLLGDSDAILQEARRAASSAYDTTSILSFYKKGSEQYDANEVVNYRSEVERIIYEKRIVYSYRPVYDVAKKKVYGYIGRAAPMNTSFASIDELKNYAIRAKDDKNLFAAMAKNLVPRFVNERLLASQKLFYPVKMNERNFLVPFFSHFRSSQEANLVFLFQEEDIAVSVDNAGLDRFLVSLDEIKNNGFGVAILLSGKSLMLDASIYAKCDAFFVDFADSADETNMDTKIRSELHALVEKLLKYGHPIIANSVMSWNAIELLVGSGLSYLSSDVFAPYETIFKPLNDKNVERIAQMKERK